MKPLVLALLVVVAGCQSGAPLAECKGPAFGLNRTHWQPTTADLEACAKIVQGKQ